MIILASASKRRIDLLKDAGVKFQVIPSFADEKIDLSLTPEENVKNIAEAKASDVYSRNDQATVIAADTIVVLNNEIFGKPKDEEEAFLMLSKLSNKTHEVMTSVCIIKDNIKDVFISKSKVKFKELHEEEIKEYIKTLEPFGKAGAYAIQGIGKSLIDTYEGDFFTIVGLPLKMVLEKIKNYN